MSGRSGGGAGGGGGGGVRSVLTPREASNLSANVTRKLDSHLENMRITHGEAIKKLQNEISEAKSSSDSLKDKSNMNSLQESALQDMEKQLISANSIVEETRKNLKRIEEDSDNIRRARDLAVDEKENLRVMCDRQASEISQMKDEMSNIMSQLQKAIAEKCEALSKSDEVQNKESLLETKEKRFESDKVHLNNQIKSLSGDLNRYTSELQNIQHEHASKMSVLEAKLNEKCEELQSVNFNINSLKELNEKLTMENKNQSKKLLSQNDIENLILMDYKKEINAKTKLIDLYLKDIDDSNARNGELNRRVTDLQQLTSSLTEQTKELEVQNKQLKTEYETMLSDNGNAITTLTSELNEAKTRLSATKEESLQFLLKDLSPFASSTCELIKSMSLTQVYGQLVRLSEELSNEKKEAAILAEKVTNLSAEIKEKTDAIQQQDSEMKVMLDNSTTMKKDLESIQSEYNQLKASNNEILKERNVFTQENARLKLEVANLSRQVCFFLDEIESEDNNKMDTSDTLTKDMITFSNISELQANNIKLLNLVEELKLDKENCKAGQVSKESQFLVDSLNVQVSELTKTQNDQIKIIDALTLQRDRYEKLYRENIISQSPKSDAIRISDAVVAVDENPKGSPSDVPSDKGAIKTPITDVQRQKERHKRYEETMMARENLLTERLEDLQKKLHELNDKYAKCFSVSKTNSEKCETLDRAVQTYKKQITSLEERNKIYESSIVKQEESIKYLRDQLLDSLTKLSTAEVTVENLRQESKFLKDSENRLKKERDLLKKERFSQSLILNDIELIKISEKRKDDENLINLESKLNASIKECSDLQRKLKTQEDKVNELNSQLERQTKNHDDRIKEANSSIERSKSEISMLHEQLKLKASQVEDLNKRLLNLININGQEDNPDVMKKVKDLENLLDDRKTEIEKLQQELIESKQLIKTSRDKCESTEIEFRKMESCYTEYKTIMEKTLNSLRESEKQLKEKTSKLEAELSSQPHDMNIMNNNELKTELSKSRETIESLKLALNEKSTNLDNLNVEVTKLKENVQKAEDKYAYEMVLHSMDVRTMTQFKQELTNLKTEIANLKSEKDHSDNSLKESKSSWESREKEFVKEHEDLQARLNDLNQHNSLLHEQIQALSLQNASFQNNTNVDNTNDAQSADTSVNRSMNTDDEKSLEHLMLIIKHLRREKDIFSTKFDMIHAEKSRMKSELEIMESQLKELHALTVEKESSVSSPQMFMNNPEIIRKMEAMNALTDSNVILRQERDSFLKKVNDLSEKVSNNDKSISTLGKSNTELQTKVESLQSENTHLKSESVRWRTRVNSLVEKANKTSPEDWKRLQNERETLAKMLTTEKENAKKLNDEMQSLKTMKSKLSDEVSTLNQKIVLLNSSFKKQNEELSTLRSDVTRITQELVEAKASILEKSDSLNKVNEALASKDAVFSETSKREVHLRKIAKKYKALYEELTAEAEKKAKTSNNETLTNAETTPEAEKDANEKLKEIETNKIAELTAQINAKLEENTKLQNEIAALRTTQDVDEKTKQQLIEANANISQLTEANTTLNSELTTAKQLVENSKDDCDVKLNHLKSQLEERITKLDKDKNQCEQEKKSLSAELNRKIEYLLHKIGQLQRKIDQSSKPSTSSYQGEKSASEAPTTIKIASVSASIANAISSSACSSQNIIENLPSSSSPMTCRQISQLHGATLPPESTQDIESINIRGIRSESAEAAAPTQTTDGSQHSHQTMLTMPHLEKASVSGTSSSQAHQQASSSSSNNNSNSTVTTSHRIDDAESEQRVRKRLRQSADEGKSDCSKRSKIQRLAEMESEYQVPTSSQRDQEDDCVIVDSGDDENQYENNYVETIEDEEDKRGNIAEVSEDKNTQVERSSSSAVSEGAMENNEVELLESIPQEDQSSNRVEDSMSNSNEARADPVGTPSTPHSPNREQQIETISSVTEGNESGNGYMSLGMVMGNVGSAGTVNLVYDDTSDSIVPSTPVLYVPRRNDGFGEAVSSPLTISGGSTADGHFTFNENNASANSGAMEDTHADLTSQIAPHLPTTPEIESNPTQETSEAEAGGSSQENADEESPMVSSQGSLPASPQQIEESSEAEASSTALANNSSQKGPWTRGSVSTPSRSSPTPQSSGNRVSDYHLRPFSQRVQRQSKSPRGRQNQYKKN
ncbi:nucleoprotein TPR-like [Arctopsyche grandis]|uniref:nucleoprotein TPR-like n=1 Tax=Arctopsyche grandis TaxID=121162 RepID=UPI00406D875B